MFKSGGFSVQNVRLVHDHKAHSGARNCASPALSLWVFTILEVGSIFVPLLQMRKLKLTDMPKVTKLVSSRNT